jgi:hypothetical protein
MRPCIDPLSIDDPDAACEESRKVGQRTTGLDCILLRAIGLVSIPTASQNAPRLVDVVGLQCFHQDELLARLFPMNCKMSGILSVRDHVGVHLEHLPGRHVSEIFQHPTSINNVYGIAGQGGK